MKAVAVAFVVAVLAGVGLPSAGAATSGKGIVVIETKLGYVGGRAAGTGMVITPGGDVLTNNHVIRGATAIRVVDPGSRRSRAATVVGYDVADDVALLRLRGTSRLGTVTLGASRGLRIGQLVTGIGNAGGTGRLTRVAGQITGLGRAITAVDEEGDAERLGGLIETSAHIVAGDSGGALVDAAGRVVGMNTAASNSFVFQDVGVSDGYAIPIAKALSIARLIRAGKSSPRIHIGPTAFLGVSLATGSGPTAGVLVGDVTADGPAAKAGLQSGDVVVRLDGTAVATSKALRSALLAKRPGQKVRIVYTDRNGASLTTAATLAAGPPQ